MMAQRIHPKRRLSMPKLALLAAMAMLAWRTVESTQRSASPTAMAAERMMARALLVAREERQALGLMPGREIDPNQTGLIGAEWSPIVTTLGDLPAKRTAANPQLAAAIVDALAPLRLAPGERAVVVLSGSLVGANLAARVALEAMGIEVVAIASLAASTYGAADPDLTWLDLEAAWWRQGILSSRSRLAVLGGADANGRDLSPAARQSLRDAARRSEVPLLETLTLAETISAVRAAIGERPVRLFVNVGGSVLGLGDCPGAERWRPGLLRRQPACPEGTPGLITAMAAENVPVLHLLDLRRLALAWGLPFDPVPLPTARSGES